MVRPCESRLVSLTCSALYVELPLGLELLTMFRYCGYGRSACATDPVKPAYGILIPAACAAADVTLCVSNEPRERYFGSTWLMLIRAVPRSVPLTPTYAASSDIFPENSC